LANFLSQDCCNLLAPHTQQKCNQISGYTVIAEVRPTTKKINIIVFHDIKVNYVNEPQEWIVHIMLCHCSVLPDGVIIFYTVGVSHIMYYNNIYCSNKSSRRVKNALCTSIFNNIQHCNIIRLLCEAFDA